MCSICTESETGMLSSESRHGCCIYFWTNALEKVQIYFSFYLRVNYQGRLGFLIWSATNVKRGQFWIKNWLGVKTYLLQKSQNQCSVWWGCGPIIYLNELDIMYLKHLLKDFSLKKCLKVNILFNFLFNAFKIWE